MKLKIIVVGKDKQDPLLSAGDDYLGRLKHYLPTEHVFLKEEPLRKNSSVPKVKAAEATRIRAALGPNDYLICLDERGREFTSVQLAQKIDSYTQRGMSQVSLVIGGPSGLDPELMKSAQERWALSQMTLPHRFARLLLLEQLYRACTINRGEPYHK